MKKIIFLVVLLMGAAGAVWYFSSSSGSLKADYYAAYLPQNTLATVSLHDLKQLSATFPASPLGHFFAKPAMHGVLSELGVPEQGVQEYDDIYDGIAGVMTDPAFQQVFGDDGVVAVLSPDVTRLRKDGGDELKKSLLLFGTSSVAGPLESFARLVMSKDVSRETVNGLEMSRITVDDNEVLYGYAKKGVLLLAYEAANIARAVKQKESGSGLLDSTAFKQAQSFWAESSLARIYSRNFVNSAAVRSLLTATDDKQAEQVAAFLQGISSVNSVVAGDDSTLRFSTRFEHVYDQLHATVKKQLKAASDKNLSLGMVNSNALIYYWVSPLHKEYLQELLSVTNMARYEQIDKMVQQELGVDLATLLSAVGPQLGLVMNDMVDTGLFPLPKIVCFLQIRDSQRAKTLLDTLRKRIKEQGFAAEQTEQVNGHTIYYWSILPGEATQLALVQTKNMFYLANGKASLKPFLQDDYTPDALPDQMSGVVGTDLARQITTSNYTTVVVRPALLATRIRGGINWLVGMLEATQGKKADALRKSLFGLLESVDVFTTTTDIRKERTLAIMDFTLKNETAPVSK